MTDRRELIAGAALGDLTQEELAEAHALGVRQDEVDAMELAVAASLVAVARDDAMPPALRARLEAPLPKPLQKPTVVPLRPKRDVWRTLGWLAAAACLAFAIVSILRPWERKKTTTARDDRDALSHVADAQVLPWTATTDPAGAVAQGDVVWSNTQQRGFMRFKGLSQNDPAATQYQLWIFDGERDDKFPVDGGVFDVTTGGDVVVPIRAKLKVGKPVLFAVTVEKPGGVVVSKRERIVVTAKAGG
ncbi:MAG TPA: anti-sigma factor [Polyangiaceae bacterium]|jgi:anti-sigma-K factor RskA|nr:anti-sigma factor [Polyangiaceae bacterium]